MNVVQLRITAALSSIELVFLYYVVAAQYRQERRLLIQNPVAKRCLWCLPVAPALRRAADHAHFCYSATGI